MPVSVRNRLFKRHSTLPLLGLVLVCIYLWAFFGGRPANRLVCEMFIQMTLVIGMSIFIGNSGVMSFGHVGFMAAGAYLSAWLTMPPVMKGMMTPWLPESIAGLELPFAVAAPLSGIAAALIALLTGAALMRLSGIAAAIGTFAFLLIVNILISNADGLTGGTSSLAGIPVNVGAVTALLVTFGAVVIAHVYRNSSAGLALQGSRDDDVAAQASGVDIFRHRLFAYVLSAFVCGVAGSVYAQYTGVISAAAFYTETTFLALAMLICGGMFSLSGAVVGVLVITIVRQGLISLEKGYQISGSLWHLPPGTEAVLIGVAMIVILIRRPSGLTGNKELSLSLPGSGPKR